MEEEYVVLSVILQSRYRLLCGPFAKRLVIGEIFNCLYTNSYEEREEMTEILSRYYRTLDPVAVHDYLEKSSCVNKVEERFKLRLPYHVLSEHELGGYYFENRGANYNGYKVIRKKYPGSRGIFDVSRVGFNESKTQAIVEVGIIFNGLSGQWNFYILENIHGQWKIKKVIGWAIA